jgi:hypothetical protein
LHHWKVAIGLVLLLWGTSACRYQAKWSSHQHATLAAINLMDGGGMTAHATASGFFVLLGVGLLTGFSHCIGMCGPLVGAFTMHHRAEKHEISMPLALFQTGRLTTYTLLGSLAGSAGSVLAAAVRDWQGVLAVALGVLVVLLGLGLLDLFPLQRWLASAAPARVVSRWIRRGMTSQHPAAPFGFGLANGLLPCGPVYAMALLAATSGDPLKGASIMLVFGLGTLPALLGFGFSAAFLSHRLRTPLYRVAAILVVIVGLQLTLRGLALHGHISHTAIGGIMLW